MKHVIRKATKADAKDIASLYLVFWEPHKGLDPLLEMKKRPTLKSEIQCALKTIRKRTTYTFVAVDKNDKITGFIEFLIKKNPPEFTIEQYGYLNACAVHPKYRGKGIAKSLVDFSISFLKEKGVEYYKLNVYIANTGACETWTKLGFTESSLYMMRRI